MIARLIISIIAPPVMVYAYFAGLWTGMRFAFSLAWADTMAELGSIKRAWRSKSLRPEKWQ